MGCGSPWRWAGERWLTTAIGGTLHPNSLRQCVPALCGSSLAHCWVVYYILRLKPVGCQTGSVVAWHDAPGSANSTNSACCGQVLLLVSGAFSKSTQ